jgi:collagenase-like PrtC family protease
MLYRTEKLPVISKEYKNVKWKAPFLFAHDDLFLELALILEKLGVKIPIDSVYGGIPCRWDTNRVPCKVSNDEQVKNSLQLYNSRNIACCFTFNNFDVTEDMLSDEIPNAILKLASESEVDNYAIISSDILYSYIKEKYPKIKLISSVIRPYNEFVVTSDTPQYYNNLCNKYDRVVIRAELNFDYKFLKKLKYKNKIELLVNNWCVFNCSLRHFHYRRLSEKSMDKDNLTFCNNKKKDIDYINNNTLLSRNDIIKLEKLGFEYFKLDGRYWTDIELFNDVISRYIFEPTGIIQPLKNFLSINNK